MGKTRKDRGKQEEQEEQIGGELKVCVCVCARLRVWIQVFILIINVHFLCLWELHSIIPQRPAVYLNPLKGWRENRQMKREVERGEERRRRVEGEGGGGGGRT